MSQKDMNQRENIKGNSLAKSPEFTANLWSSIQWSFKIRSSSKIYF